MSADKTVRLVISPTDGYNLTSERRTSRDLIVISDRGGYKSTQLSLRSWLAVYGRLTLGSLDKCSMEFFNAALEAAQRFDDMAFSSPNPTYMEYDWFTHICTS